MTAEPYVEVVRLPSVTGIALDLAPHVRLGHITEREASELLSLRYNLALIEMRHEGAARSQERR